MTNRRNFPARQYPTTYGPKRI